MSAPYTRTYQHTGGRGHEKYVNCNFCGKRAPRYKCFVTHKGFRLTDPVLRKEIKCMSFENKVYVCPSCARHRGIVQIGKSRKSRTASQL